MRVATMVRRTSAGSGRSGKATFVLVGVVLAVMLMLPFLYATYTGTAVDFNAVSALSGVVAAVVAALALIAENQRSRFSTGVDLLLSLDDRFNSEGMRNVRRMAAQEIIGKKPAENVDEVLDFFEMVGLLVHKGALDVWIVWHEFSPWIRRYFYALKDYLDKWRKDDPTVYSDFVTLHEELTRIEMKETGCSRQDDIPSKGALDEFLKDELNLAPTR